MDSVKKYAKKLEKLIKEHSVAAAIISAIAGFVLGMAF